VKDSGEEVPSSPFSMQKPTGDFFSTLGYYVYWYTDGINPYYIGKGVGDRCWAHVIDKNYDPTDLHIVAKNLSEDQAIVLESYLIFTHNPRDNRVSGHHTERFAMASLSSMFTEFESCQYDNFETLPAWYVDNYARSFRGKIRELKISSSTTFVLSSANKQMYMMFYWNPTDVESPIKVTFEMSLPEGEQMNALKKKCVEWLKTEDYKKTFPDGKAQKLAVNVDGIGNVLKLWDAFWS